MAYAEPFGVVFFFFFLWGWWNPTQHTAAFQGLM
jgi:hypothetical protein